MMLAVCDIQVLEPVQGGMKNKHTAPPPTPLIMFSN